MNISETYSHLNGLEFLLVHKPNLFGIMFTSVEGYTLVFILDFSHLFILIFPHGNISSVTVRICG